MTELIKWMERIEAGAHRRLLVQVHAREKNLLGRLCSNIQ